MFLTADSAAFLESYGLDTPTLKDGDLYHSALNRRKL